jgi:hypothetical protein
LSRVPFAPADGLIATTRPPRLKAEIKEAQDEDQRGANQDERRFKIFVHTNVSVFCRNSGVQQVFCTDRFVECPSFRAVNLTRLSDNMIVFAQQIQFDKKKSFESP